MADAEVWPVDASLMHRRLEGQLGQLIAKKNERLHQTRLREEIVEMRRQIREFGKEPIA